MAESVSRQSGGALAGDIIENLAAIRWCMAGAVIPWERADPEVQERYRQKVTFRNTYDERGLCRFVDQEDEMVCVEYLPDLERGSRYVKAGEREWVSFADLEAVV